MEKVTVLMPVGPNYNKEWLKEAVDSILRQTVKVDELLIVNDSEQLIHPSHLIYDFNLNNYTFEWVGAGPYSLGKTIFSAASNFPAIVYWNNPSNIGFTSSFNTGMGVASNELVVYLAADDRLEPTAVERAVQTYLDNDKKDAWYSYTYVSSTGDVSSIPINAALITKKLWKMVGGYPPAGFVGPDALILSCLIAHAPDRIIKIDEGEPLYWFRDHPEQETKTHTWKFVDEMNSIRNKITAGFKLKEI